MKRVGTIVLFLGLLGLGFYFARRFWFRQVNLGNLISLYTPSKKDIKQFLPQGAELNSPLNIPEGFRLGVFADLEGALPRVLALDPGGVVVASLTKDGRVVALPDDNNDGAADRIVNILTGLDRPHGIVFYQGKLYVAETDKVVRYSYDARNFTASSPEKLFDLPSGGRHFTRTIKIKGDKLYTSVGSSCDTCVEEDPRRSVILVSDLNGGGLTTYASGLRNTVFFAFDARNRLWGNDMGRDFLGDDLPPDELNIISNRKDYGWPYCFGDRVRDAKFKSTEKSTYCLDTEPTAFNYPAHTAPLGLTFIDSDIFPAKDQGDLLVAMHGSWNRSEPVGYKIVKLSIFSGAVSNSEDFLSGWLTNSEVLGRPVDLIFDKNGNLYISDDKAGLIYILTKEL